MADNWTYPSVREYVAAKKRGDRATTDRIMREVKVRFETRTTDGSEIAELHRATMVVAFGEGE